MRLLLFSDLHLDSTFAWADTILAADRRRALRQALDRICQLARSLRADAVCCAGDLFEHERCAPDTARFLRDSFAALDRIRVFLAPGEQDWLGAASAYRYTSWSSNVHLFTEPRLTAFPLADGLTLWGAAHCAPSDTPGFLDGFRVNRAGVNLALFHGCERNAGGRQDAHRPAPFHDQQIAAAGLQHAMVGHLHAFRSTPSYTYAGNPEPLSFGEAPGQRGVALITVDEQGWVSSVLHPVATTRMDAVSVNVDGVETTGELRERVAVALAGARGLVRATLVGAIGPEVDLDAGLAAPTDLSRHLDRLIVRRDQVTVDYDVDALAREQTVRGQFVRDVRQSTRLTEEQRRRVLVTGLRALAGRSDLLMVS